MNEIELSSDLPTEAVSYVFKEVDEELERRGYPSHVSTIQSMRVITVNNDGRFFGVLLHIVGSAVEDWIQENYESLDEGEASELRAAKTVERRFL